MKFNFHFGKKHKTIKDYAFIGIILFILLFFLIDILKISEKRAWLLIDFIQKELNKKNLINNSINDYIIKTPELLDYRIENEVDRALERYLDEEISVAPRMTNKIILKNIQSLRFSDTQRMIIKDAIYYECPEGVMGIRGVWVDKDPKCD